MEKSQAVRFFAEIEAQERLVRSGEVAPAESLDSATAEYSRHIKRFTTRTQGHYQMVLTKFIASLPKSVVRIHQLEPAHIREYLYQLRDAGRSNRTLNAHLTVIKSFTRHSARFYKIPNSSDEVSMLTEDPPNSRFLEEDEYQKILSVASDLARTRLIFLANTGLRASEFASLKPSSYSNDLKTVTILAKGRKRRTVPLNNKARSVLKNLQPASKNALWLQCNRLALKAGVRQFGPHSLRHYFATQLLLKGTPAIVVSKLLGHKSVRTTEQCYAHILATDLANATDVLD